MPILASLIARGTVVLAEYNPHVAAFSTIARKLIEQIPPNIESKKSYSYESYNFHYLVERGITYICMTDQEMGYRIPYAFLLDLSNRFRAQYGEKIMTASANAMNDSFSRVMHERQDFFSNDRNADKITKVKGEIEDAKNVMVQNIEKVLARGEKIEVLVDKTEDLNQQSQSFKKKSTQLKRKMWWKNAKLCCLLITIVAAIIAAVICGILYYTGVFSKITDSSSSSSTSTTGSSKTITSAATTAAATTTAATTGTTATTAATTSATTSTTTTAATTATGTTGTLQ